MDVLTRSTLIETQSNYSKAKKQHNLAHNVHTIASVVSVSKDNVTFSPNFPAKVLISSNLLVDAGEYFNPISTSISPESTMDSEF